MLYLSFSSFFSAVQPLPAIEEKTKDLKKYEGFFHFYWDENSGKIWLEVDKTVTELLYVTSLPLGLDSNDLDSERELFGCKNFVKFSKREKKKVLIQPAYCFQPSAKMFLFLHFIPFIKSIRLNSIPL